MNKFVARQPIFRRNRTVFGYELLFRSNLENFFHSDQSPDKASSSVLVDSFLLFGVNKITGGRKAFIRSQWKDASQYAHAARVDESSVADAYIDAVSWVERILSLEAA